jgi:hypothetical protein
VCGDDGVSTLLETVDLVDSRLKGGDLLFG